MKKGVEKTKKIFIDNKKLEKVLDEDAKSTEKIKKVLEEDEEVIEEEIRTLEERIGKIEDVIASTRPSLEQVEVLREIPATSISTERRDERTKIDYSQGYASSTDYQIKKEINDPMKVGQVGLMDSNDVYLDRQKIDEQTGLDRGKYFVSDGKLVRQEENFGTLDADRIRYKGKSR